VYISLYVLIFDAKLHIFVVRIGQIINKEGFVHYFDTSFSEREKAIAFFRTETGAKAPDQDTAIKFRWCKITRRSKRKKKLHTSPGNFATRTLQLLLQNVIRPFNILHQEPDGAPLSAAAPTPGTTPLRPALQVNHRDEA
jgi:hypothetical protein